MYDTTVLALEAVGAMAVLVVASQLVGYAASRIGYRIARRRMERRLCREFDRKYRRRP